MKHNKSNFKSKRSQMAKQGVGIRRHEPRCRFPCNCCEYVMPVRYGMVFTACRGEKLEVCSDCLADPEVCEVNHCANCNNEQPQSGVKLVDTASNKSLIVCRSCFDSRKRISEYFNGEPHSDSGSVF
ncbi:hypothetical protein [Vibrio sp. OPT18]|uniref:hypothetical protein n=1 Tax=Vibrio sp. OPT18 TaxID=2778641 RepID=UPI001881C072|nr:hypothetical protein [Vibrio sp. OPT18]MBE8578691.1 hypothetical protein [Vibrio sp. OPT18]